MDMLSTSLASAGRLPLRVAALASVLLPLPAAAANYAVDCSGGTSGAFTSIGAALAAAVADPPIADRYILLKGNCTENVTIGGGVHRVWIAPEWDACPWSGCTTNGRPAQITAANASQPVIAVSGDSDVTLVHLTLTGGTFGLRVTGASVVAYGVTAENNSASGLQASSGASLVVGEGGARNNRGAGLTVGNGSTASVYGHQSWLQNQPFVLSGNGYAGLQVDRAVVVGGPGTSIESNKGPGILAFGGDVLFGTTADSPAVVSGNAGGAYLSEGTQASFWGSTTFRDNGAIGIYVEKTSHAGLYGAVVEGHGENGVDAVANSQVSFHGANRIRNNGADARSWSAGVRVDGSSSAFFDAGADPAGPSTISDNTGAGILVDLNSSVEVHAAAIRGNTREGVRVRRGSVADVGRAVDLRPNGEGPISCDRSSNVFGDRLHRSPSCWNVDREGDPRPARPIAGQ
jgi:hypothetical protein